MHYNDREALGVYELWTPDSDLRTSWDDEVFTLMLSENHASGSTKASAWLTPKAAALLAEELLSWSTKMFADNSRMEFET